MAAGLFENEAPLLPWLPDETLFSLCSRHHRLWGHATSSSSTLALFGGRRAGTHHDLPSSISEFATRTDGCFGAASEIARERTLLRYYRPFLTTSEVCDAAETMCGPSVVHLKFRLGLLTSRFRAHHPLKACRSCMRADVATEGWAYWHLQHQFPGVWICPQHGEPLLTSTVKSTGVERFLWHLPIEGRLRAESADLPAAPLDALARLAGLTAALVGRDVEDGWLAAPAVQGTLRGRLAERGWVTASGSTRLQEAAGDYLAHCEALRAVAELHSLPANLAEAKAQLSRLIRPLRTGTHPLRLLVAIGWLFKDSDAFIASHARALHVADRPIGTATEAPLPSPRIADPRKEHLLELLRSGKSATAAARSIGIDVLTAMAWATSAGIAVKRRPKILSDELRQPLVRDIGDGLGKAEAAARYGVSVETVTKVLRTEVGLHALWTAARLATARNAAREAWLGLLAQYRSLGVKLMRASNPAAYAWLYRNDQGWLREHTPDERANTSACRTGNVRWDQRDEALSLAVRQAIERLSDAQPHKPLRLWQIYQAVPELKPKLSALERLPLTRRALESALGPARARTSSGSLFD